ncbi:MAG TPA: tetratricopeptide repeat protein, partial [Roseiflexaceae bacterium]
DERRLFTRLSVFAGGCAVEPAEAVCGDQGPGIRDQEAGIAQPSPPTPDPRPPTSVLDGLSSLVDKSLLRQIEAGDDESRFSMIETIRDFAADRLDHEGEAEALRERHAEYYLAFAEAAEPQLDGPEQATWLERLEREHDNLRAALDWALDRGESEIALRLSGALWRFWHTRGYLSEGRRLLASALKLADGGRPPAPADAAAPDAPIRANVLAGSGRLALTQGGDERAKEFYEQALALYRALGDRRGTARALNRLAGIAGRANDYDRANALFHEALALFRELGDRIYIARVLSNRSLIALRRDDDAQAQALLEESLALRRQLDDTIGIVWSLANLGEVAHRRGDSDQAGVRYAESLALGRKLGAREAIAVCLEGLAQIAAARDRLERAARLWGAAEALRESIGAYGQQVWRARYESAVTAARARAGREAFETAWADGRETPLDRLIDELARAG